MSPITVAYIIFVALVAGVVAGYLLSKTIHGDIALVRQGSQLAFNAVAQDMNKLHERVKSLEDAASAEVSHIIH